MNSEIQKIYDAAKKKGACKEGLEWLKQLPEDATGAVLNDMEAVVRGYMPWCYQNIPELLPAPTAEQYEKGLTDIDWVVRWNWAQRTDLTPTAEQYERGLKDEDRLVRSAWARRTDIAPTAEQYERGLEDESCGVRSAWAQRTGLEHLKEKR